MKKKQFTEDSRAIHLFAGNTNVIIRNTFKKCKNQQNISKKFDKTTVMSPQLTNLICTVTLAQYGAVFTV